MPQLFSVNIQKKIQLCLDICVNISFITVVTFSISTYRTFQMENIILIIAGVCNLCLMGFNYYTDFVLKYRWLILGKLGLAVLFGVGYMVSFFRFWISNDKYIIVPLFFAGMIHSMSCANEIMLTLNLRQEAKLNPKKEGGLNYIPFLEEPNNDNIKIQEIQMSDKNKFEPEIMGIKN